MPWVQSLFRFYISKPVLIAVLASLSYSLTQATTASAQTIPIFSEGELKQERGMTLGDPKKWGTPVSGLKGASEGGKLPFNLTIFEARAMLCVSSGRQKWSRAKLQSMAHRRI